MLSCRGNRKSQNNFLDNPQNKYQKQMTHLIEHNLVTMKKNPSASRCLLGTAS